MTTHITWSEFWLGNWGKENGNWKYILAQLDPMIEFASTEVKKEMLKDAPEQVKQHYYKNGYLPNPKSISLKRQYVRR